MYEIYWHIILEALKLIIGTYETSEPDTLVSSAGIFIPESIEDLILKNLVVILNIFIEFST